MLQEKDFTTDGDISWHEATLLLPEVITLSVPKTEAPFEDTLPKLNAFYSQFLKKKNEIKSEAGKKVSEKKGITLSSEEIVDTMTLFDVSIYADGDAYMMTLLYKDTQEILEGRNVEVRLGKDLNVLEVGLAG